MKSIARITYARTVLRYVANALDNAKRVGNPPDMIRRLAASVAEARLNYALGMRELAASNALMHRYSRQLGGRFRAVLVAPGGRIVWTSCTTYGHRQSAQRVAANRRGALTRAAILED